MEPEPRPERELSRIQSRTSGFQFLSRGKVLVPQKDPGAQQFPTNNIKNIKSFSFLIKHPSLDGGYLSSVVKEIMKTLWVKLNLLLSTYLYSF